MTMIASGSTSSSKSSPTISFKDDIVSGGGQTRQTRKRRRRQTQTRRRCCSVVVFFLQWCVRRRDLYCMMIMAILLLVLFQIMMHFQSIGMMTPFSPIPSTLSSSLSSSSSSSQTFNYSPYDPSKDPVYSFVSSPSSSNVENIQFPSNFLLKVGIVTISPLVGEAKHFLYDGVLHSDVMELIHVVSLYGNTNDTIMMNYSNNDDDDWKHKQPQQQQQQPSPNAVDLWIVDGARVAKLQRTFLDQIFYNSSSWKVLIMDYTDRFEFQLRHYYRHHIFQQSHVRLAVRSIVQGRHYDDHNNNNFNSNQTTTTRQQHIIPGRIASNIPSTNGGPTLHVPYAVRTDMVHEIKRQIINSTSSPSTMTMTMTVTTMELSQVLFDPRTYDDYRSIDVLHLWKLSYREGKSKFRNTVSQLVRSWNGTSSSFQVHNNNGDPNNNNNTTTTIHTSIEEHGQRRHVGRNIVHSNYVRALLSTKIVIVTQKDDWEDHYRLFESMICGPLVLHDAMVAPPKGLQHQQTIVFFHDLQDLEQYVRYYLEHDEERKVIARRGWELAMGRHRSWHRIEELVFGRPMTKVDPRYRDL